MDGYAKKVIEREIEQLKRDIEGEDYELGSAQTRAQRALIRRDQLLTKRSELEAVLR